MTKVDAEWSLLESRISLLERRQDHYIKSLEAKLAVAVGALATIKFSVDTAAPGMLSSMVKFIDMHLAEIEKL